LDFGRWSGAGVRPRGFWAGWGGWLTTIAIGAIVVALLVGWVLLWVNRPQGPSISLLVLGCIAFTLVLAMLATLQTRLAKNWRLQQAEALFLTGISHNLKTPISGIRTAAQTLRTATLDNEQRHALLNVIVAETRRLSLRVENVLETGRLEVETQVFDEAPLDLADLLSGMLRGAEGVVSTRGGELQSDIPGPVWVHGDDHALRLLFDNLMDNALKYTDDAPQVGVTLVEREPFALVRIMDGGIGFSQQDDGMLFRRFQRGDTGRAGTGLGLPLARAIARGHGGEVHVYSDGPGLGAVAEVWLPLVGATHG